MSTRLYFVNNRQIIFPLIRNHGVDNLFYILDIILKFNNIGTHNNPLAPRPIDLAAEISPSVH